MSRARFKSSKLHPCWSALAWSAAVACSGSTQPAAQVGTDGVEPGTGDTELANTAPDEQPITVQTVEESDPAATFDGCLSARSDHVVDAASYAVWTYDPESRVLTEVLSDEHGTPVSHVATYVDALDMSQDQEGLVYAAITYTNEYDEAGLLTRQSV